MPAQEGDIELSVDPASERDAHVPVRFLDERVPLGQHENFDAPRHADCNLLEPGLEPLELARRLGPRAVGGPQPGGHEALRVLGPQRTRAPVRLGPCLEAQCGCSHAQPSERAAEGLGAAVGNPFVQAGPRAEAHGDPLVVELHDHLAKHRLALLDGGLDELVPRIEGSRLHAVHHAPADTHRELAQPNACLDALVPAAKGSPDSRVQRAP